ncbi:MAG: leucine-rich repeat domain-containing protein [Promethearchaeota archaeon]
MHSLIKCSSCGKPLTDFELQIFEKKKNDIAKLDNKILENNLILCSKCTMNYSILPRFISIVNVFARYYFMEKGIKNQEEAIQKAVNYVSVQPYWKNHIEKQIESKNIAKVFESFQVSKDIIDKYIEQEYNEEYEEERPDIFLSHSWNGPDKEVVDILARKLEEMGYTIWYDKFKGLKPGDIEQYLETAVLDSFFCVPVICKPYFEGKFTVKELDMLYKFKEKKNIIPVWYSDIDPSYLRSKGELGELLLNTAAITWEGVNKDVDELARKIDEFISKSKNIDVYNGAELYEFEALALRRIESIIGAPIPQLPAEVQKDISESKIFSLSDYDFGFAHHEHHVTALVLKKIGGRVVPLRISNNILSKLKYLRHFAAPLIELSPKLNLPPDLIEFNIDNGKVKYLPENIAKLSKLAIFSCKNIPIERIHEAIYPIIKKILNKKNLYNDLDIFDAVNLYILLESINNPELMKSFSINDEFVFGYSPKAGKIVKLAISNKYIRALSPIIGTFSKLRQLDLSSIEVSSLPESIGRLNNLKELRINNNKLSSLPESIGRLNNLKELRINNNKLSSLPESIGRLNNLRELYLGDNELSSLPESIGNLNNLQKLYLEKNKLSSLPESIGRLNNLKELRINNNKLSSLPESIGNLNNLKELLINNNQLSSLPESIGRLNNLQTLKIYDNLLTAFPEDLLTCFPENMGHLINLRELYLGDNELSSLPENIGRLINLKELDLEFNKLSSLPESIGRLINLKELNLGDNELSSLPESIGRLTNLQTLIIHNNKLSSLPESIGRLTNLEYLLIDLNQLLSLSKRSNAQLEELRNHGTTFVTIN